MKYPSISSLALDGGNFLKKKFLLGISNINHGIHLGLEFPLPVWPKNPQENLKRLQVGNIHMCLAELNKSLFGRTILNLGL